MLFVQYYLGKISIVKVRDIIERTCVILYLVVKQRDIGKTKVINLRKNLSERDASFSTDSVYRFTFVYYKLKPACDVIWYCVSRCDGFLPIITEQWRTGRLRKCIVRDIYPILFFRVNFSVTKRCVICLVSFLRFTFFHLMLSVQRKRIVMLSGDDILLA